jgi:hypothetical protein
VEQAKPDLALISVERNDPMTTRVVERAYAYLRGLGVPVVVAASSATAADPDLVDWLDQFTALVESPYDPMAIERAITMAAGEIRVTGESVGVPGWDEDSAGGGDAAWTSPWDTVERAARVTRHEGRGPRDAAVETGPWTAAPAGQTGETAARRSAEAAAVMRTHRGLTTPLGPAKATADEPAPGEDAHESVEDELEVGELGDGDFETGWEEDDLADLDEDDEIEVRVWGAETLSGERPAVGDGRLPTGDSPSYVAREPGGERATSARVVRPRLPPLEAGDTGLASLLRVFYAHHAIKSTGILTIEQAGVSREVGYRQGEVGLVDVSGSLARERERLATSLVWEQARYRFGEAPLRRRRFRRVGNVLKLIHEVIHSRLGVNQLARQLTDQLKLYPVLTDRIAANRDILDGLEGVGRFLHACGDASLEMVVAKSPTEMEALLKNAYFSLVTDLVYLTDRPESGYVVVRYAGLEEADEPPRFESPEEELTDRVERWSALTAYELLGLEPGCGQVVLRDRYYRMVKRHHPDVYGASRETRVRPLAERVFMMLQRAYRDVRRRERASDLGVEPGPEFEEPRVGGTFAAAADARASGRVERQTTARVPRPPPRKAPSTPPPEPSTVAVGSAKDAPGDTTGDSSESVRPVQPTSELLAALRRSYTRKDSGQRMAVPKSNPEQRFKFGVSCLKTGAVDRAREAFAEAVEAEPENGLYLAHFHYSRYLIDQSAAKGVIARLKDLARDDEGRETALLFLGHIERGRGKLDLATKYYRLCLRMNPRNVEAKRQMRLFDMRTSKRKTGVLERLFSKPGKKRS